MESCQQDVSKRFQAEALQFGMMIGNDSRFLINFWTNSEKNPELNGDDV